LKVHLHFPHKIKNSAIQQLVEQYCRFARRYVKVEWTTRPIRTPQGNARPELLEALKTGRGVLLSEHGKAVDTHWFRDAVDRALTTSQPLHFVVGDAYGYPPEIEQSCPDKIALTPLTLPHEMALMILTEQVWRAISMLRNHPYHK